MRKYGLSEVEFQILKDLLIDPLKDQGAQLWIFGSRARGDHQKFSDIDILFSVSKKLPEIFLFNIKDSLEESNLPYKVDLVNLENLAKSYRDDVLKDRIQL